MLIPLDLVSPTFPFFNVLKEIIDLKYKNERQVIQNEAVIITHRVARTVFQENENKFYSAFEGTKYLIKEEVPGGDFILYYGDVVKDTDD